MTLYIIFFVAGYGAGRKHNAVGVADGYFLKLVFCSWGEGGFRARPEYPSRLCKSCRTAHRVDPGKVDNHILGVMEFFQLVGDFGDVYHRTPAECYTPVVFMQQFIICCTLWMFVEKVATIILFCGYSGRICRQLLPHAPLGHTVALTFDIGES